MSNNNDAASSSDAATRPFCFEDLAGKPEPEAWGPVYPELASVAKHRRLDRKRALTPAEVKAYGAAVGAAIRALNAPKHRESPFTPQCASGQWGEYDREKHRAKLRTKLGSDAAVDRRRRTDKQIIAAYEEAMRARFAAQRAIEAALGLAA